LRRSLAGNSCDHQECNSIAMIRIPISALSRSDRPRDYAKTIINAGKVEGAFVEISDDTYVELLRRYQGGNIITRSIRFLRSIASWARQGFPISEHARYISRRAACATCIHWEGKRWFGSGKCKLCGCATAIKLRMASEKCPANPPRWLAAQPKFQRDNRKVLT